jgi:ribosomal protein L7Ae-like RNA K-turn-binding protein
MVCDAMRAGKKLWLVVEACDTSENTHKRITDRCSYYGVRHVRIEVKTDALAHAMGKSGDLAVVAVTDESLAGGILKLLSASPGDGSI